MEANKDFKIKLIFPPLFEEDVRFDNSVDLYHLPYGMGILTAFLRKHNYYVEQQDFCIKVNRHKNYLYPFLNPKTNLSISQYKEEICSILKTGNFKCRLGLFINRLLDSNSLDGFNLIGFSIYSYYSFLFALLLSRRIKQNINIPIVFGGPFISLYHSLYPEVFNFVDYMIVGDGTVPLLRLIDYLNKKILISEVSNLIYKDDAKLVATAVEYYPLEDMPAPDFNGLPLGLYKEFRLLGPRLPYQITRGCTSKCSFCSYISLGPKIEFKSYEKVINELRQMKNIYSNNIFYFTIGATIDNSYEYLDGLCDILINERLDIIWRAFARVNRLNKDLLKKMYKAGCRSLLFGIESGSDRILKIMNKGFSSEQASRTLQLAYEARIKSHIFLIIGYPTETRQDINQTIEFIKRNRRYIHHCIIRKFLLYYGTSIYLNSHEYGISNLIHDDSGYIFNFNELNGLKWEQKQRQQVDNYNRVLKVYKNTILLKKYRTDFLSFILYLLRSLFLRRRTLTFLPG